MHDPTYGHSHSHHHHPHDHVHGHDHSHDHDHHHHGHNHTPSEHLHSHFHPHDQSEELKVLTASFVDGFRAAEDKTSYLRLAGIPLSREGEDGLTMHLVDTSIIANWQIGTASPAFASRELAYMAFPGEMVSSRETMTFTYVSLTAREDVDLVDLLSARVSAES